MQYEGISSDKTDAIEHIKQAFGGLWLSIENNNRKTTKRAETAGKNVARFAVSFRFPPKVYQYYESFQWFFSRKKTANEHGFERFWKNKNRFEHV